MITSAQNEGFICVNVLLLKFTGKHTYDEHQRVEWLRTHHYVDSYMLLFHFNPDMFLVASEETSSVRQHQDMFLQLLPKINLKICTSVQCIVNAVHNCDVCKTFDN